MWICACAVRYRECQLFCGLGKYRVIKCGFAHEQFSTGNANSFVDSVSIMSLNVDLPCAVRYWECQLFCGLGKYCVIKCGFAHAQFGTANANSFADSVSIVSLNVDLRMRRLGSEMPTNSLLWTLQSSCYKI